MSQIKETCDNGFIINQYENETIVDSRKLWGDYLISNQLFRCDLLIKIVAISCLTYENNSKIKLGQTKIVVGGQRWPSRNS